jgi:hypothetical protein
VRVLTAVPRSVSATGCRPSGARRRAGSYRDTQHSSLYARFGPALAITSVRTATEHSSDGRDCIIRAHAPFSAREPLALAGALIYDASRKGPSMTAKKGTGLLMVCADVPADKEGEFNRWYNEEHLAERIAIPGFLNGARYEAVKGGPKHLAVYELESPAVLDSRAYKEVAANPTPWTQRVGPQAVATTFIRNVYIMIHPRAVTPSMAASDGAGAADPVIEEIVADVTMEPPAITLLIHRSRLIPPEAVVLS